MKTLRLPLNNSEILDSLNAGEEILLEGEILVGRDQVHKELISLLNSNLTLPVDFTDQGLFYMGPSPAPQGKIIGAAGPTTSSRMDPFTVPLLQEGLKVIVGKGPRSSKIKEAFNDYKAVYLHAYGGCGALYSKAIKKVDVIAFEHLGPEAMLRLKIQNFPCLVAFDLHQKSIY